MSSPAGRASARPRIALTTGEPAGIGPEISAVVASDYASRSNIDLVLIGDPDLLSQRARLVGVDLPQSAPIHRIDLAAPVTPGRPDPRNAHYVLATLDAAIDGCRAGTFDAMVTAPVQKSTINEAGIAFTGHTEYLAERCGVAQVVMMLAGDTAHGPLRIALATTHLKLADVARTIDAGLLRSVIRILDTDLRLRFGIERPRIAIAGVNPHAGEQGFIGREEIDIVMPLIAQMNNEGFDLEGPLPADTLFVPSVVQRFDAVLAMYHDQGLPVLKYATFGHGVNVTLGLPFVRTSVDHGTGLDLAATGGADTGSLATAVRMAADLVAHRV